MTETLRVAGMTCGGCENAVKRAVGRLPGVSTVDASHKDQRVTVSFDDALVTLDAVKARIAGLGYRVV
jgi:copper ion binding protein